MSMRAVRLRNLLLLIAIIASIVVAGCWDNRHIMQRVLDDGYPAIVEITGAQYTRAAPVAFDGWRPRFLEQGLSVDLRWDGKDGKQHTYQKVPVSEAFAATVIEGEQVKLAVLPAKVMDDPLAVPVINADAQARFASLQDWLKGSAWIALAAWAGFAGLTVWQARRGSAPLGRPTSSARLPRAFPPRLTLFGIVAMIVGAVLTFRAWSLADQAAPETDGIETTAHVTTAATISGGGARPQSRHGLQLSWTDTQGGVHHYGPVWVSETFWNKITSGGALTVHDVRIRYSGTGADAKPSVVDDPPEAGWEIKFGLVSGIALMIAGAISLFWAVRSVRYKNARQAPKK
jgi:hypothetical protein